MSDYPKGVRVGSHGNGRECTCTSGTCNKHHAQHIGGCRCTGCLDYKRYRAKFSRIGRCTPRGAHSAEATAERVFARRPLEQTLCGWDDAPSILSTHTEGSDAHEGRR